MHVIIFWFLLIIAPAAAQQYVISTYAGGALPLPDPAPGLQVSIGAPAAVAIDSAGNAYFVSQNCVFKLDRDGVLTRVAGNFRLDYAGDGGPANRAQLGPAGIAVDSEGNLFIADSWNQRIRKVSPDGVITTVAGNGGQGYSGDGGPATSAQLDLPTGVGVDGAGNLFIAHRVTLNRSAGFYTGVIRRVSATGNISTFAGAASGAQIGVPQGLAVDQAGNVFVAEFTSVQKISPDGTITTVAGTGVQGYSGDGGPATSARLNSPQGVAVDSEGNLFIAQYGAIRKVDPDGIIATVAGTGTQGYSGDNGPGMSAQLSSPAGVTVDGEGNVFIADSSNFRIRKLKTDGTIVTVAGDGLSGSFSGDGGPATGARLALGAGDPSALGGVAVDNEGNLFIADTGNHRIRKVSRNGIITTVAGTGTPGYVGNNGPAIQAQLKYPLGVAVDGAGNLFIADTGNNYVRKVSTDGIISTVPGSDSDYGLGGVAVDGAGNLFIANLDTVRKISRDGVITTVAGGGTLRDSSSDGRPATEAKLFYLCGVAVDAAGNLFIADYNDGAHKVSSDGIITTVALPGGSPSGVAVDGAGNAFFSTADSDWDISGGAERIYKVSSDGSVAAIAGIGKVGYSGDGGPATGAQLWGPAGVAVDGAGNVYFADTGNGTIRILRPTDRLDAGRGSARAARQYSQRAVAAGQRSGFVIRPLHRR